MVGTWDMSLCRQESRRCSRYNETDGMQMYQRNDRNISASLPSCSVPVPWVRSDYSPIPQLTYKGKNNWKPAPQIRITRLGSLSSIRSLTLSRNSGWFDMLVSIKPLLPGPYGFIIHSVLMMGCSVTTHMSWILERLIPRAPLCPLFKISILLALFHSFETPAAVFASSNATTNGSEV